VNSGQLFGNSTNKNTNIFYRHAATSTYITSEHHLLMTNADGIIEYDLTNNRIVSISNEINVDRNSFIQVDSTIYSFNLKGVATKQMHSGWSMKLHFKKVPADFMTYQCAVVNKNTILVTTSDGLYEYNISNNSFKRIFRDKTGANFRAIYNLRGYFLIGTYGGGVYMYKDGIIKHLPLDPNKFLEFTHCFIKDDQDHIFASTNKGLFMSTASSLIDFWDKGPGNIAYNYFGKLEGIDVLEMNGGCDPCAIRLKNGNISIPGIDGLIQFDPNYLPDLKIMPTAFLDKILINNIPFSPNILNQHLASDVKFIEFQFGVSGMLSQEDFLFEYKFDDDPWVRIGILNSNSNINIGNPGYGAHKLILRIRKSNIPKWKISTFKFYVEFPWFLHPTMFFIYFIIFSSLLYLYIKLRVVLYRRKQIELEGEIFNKTVSLRKLNASLAKRNQAKDQVIAIMNHDILTPLKYLHITSSNIVDQIQDANIKKSIEQISSTTKELEYQTSNMLNWVKFESLEKLPKKQSVDLHILVNNLIEFVEPFKQNNQVYLLNNIPPNCIVQSWPEQLRVLLYNIVMNALRSTTQGEIAMSATSNSNGFTMTVSDTGIGMSKSMANYLIIGYSKDEVENLPKHKTGNGVGYQIIRSILMLMKATIEIDSVEGKGTTVKLFFNQL
jgi:signal transduction histidine kinase